MIEIGHPSNRCKEDDKKNDAMVDTPGATTSLFLFQFLTNATLTMLFLFLCFKRSDLFNSTHSSKGISSNHLFQPPAIFCAVFFCPPLGDCYQLWCLIIFQNIQHRQTFFLYLLLHGFCFNSKGFSLPNKSINGGPYRINHLFRDS